MTRRSEVSSSCGNQRDPGLLAQITTARQGLVQNHHCCFFQSRLFKSQFQGSYYIERMRKRRVNLYLLCILDFKNPLNIIWLFNMLLFRVVLINYTLLANKVTQGQTKWSSSTIPSGQTGQTRNCKSLFPNSI